MLTEQQRFDFQERGFVILPDVVSAQERQTLIDQAYQIIDSTDLDMSSRFSTTDRAQIRHDFFLSSAQSIRCFFEEAAFNDNGTLKQARAQSINKIGHALHDLDPVFKAFASRPDFAEMAQDLGVSIPHLYQTMVIFKQPRIGGEVTWHQDATFFYTEPSSVITYWFALEEATIQNGCIWVEPGSHKGPLRERYLRDGSELTMALLDSTPWPDQQSGSAVPVPAGTLLLFHGHLPHYSAPNRSDRSRLALTFHVVDGAFNYDTRNWLQRPDLGPFVMAG